LHQGTDIIKSYIDQKKNTYSVGIKKSANASNFEQIINQFSIPTDAILIYNSSAIIAYDTRNSSALTNQVLASSHTIRDRIRPIEGGLKIENENHLPCTLGFMVKFDGFDAWITSSSCTNNFSSAPIDTDTKAFQNVAGNFNNQAGIEFQDFEGHSQGSGNYYRESNSAVFLADTFSNFGRITRTEYNNQRVWGNSGSVTIDVNHPFSLDPWFDIISDDRVLMQGMRLHKIGQGTGWTIGNVINTCTDVTSDDFNFSSPIPQNWEIRCQIQSDVYANTGDAGAPVFMQALFVPTVADLVGLHWGVNPQDRISYHSPTDGIREDFSNHTIVTH
jgi:hypothetical protein